MGEDDNSAAGRSSAEQALKDRVTFLVGAIANRLVSAGSSLYRREFGIGFSEWRIMLMLELEPGITAKRISDTVGLDKAAISRGLGWLEAQGLIEPTPETAGRRSRDFRLTPKGQDLYAKIVVIAREHERLLLAGLEPDERTQVIGLLQRLWARLPDVEAFRP